jgi:hypothetical protein
MRSRTSIAGPRSRYPIRLSLQALAFACASLLAREASAQSPRYALPFQLRPAVAPNVVRLEGTAGLRDGGGTGVLMLTVGARIVPDVSVIARAAYAIDVGPSAAAGSEVRGAFANPSLGVLYTPVVAPGMRLALFLGGALPLGEGDGLPAGAPPLLALGAARIARASMDNAMFATSHGTVAVGLAWLWLIEHVTLQLEATLLGAFRARGGQGVDAIVENLTMGAWVGYAPIEQLSFGVGLHHQRFMSTPALVRGMGEIARAQSSAAIAVRGRLEAAGLFFNPGLSYTHGLDGVLLDRGDHLITLELLVQY